MNASMDDEDDTYGFGSFSDLFDDGRASHSETSSAAVDRTDAAATATTTFTLANAYAVERKLDLRAMSRFWVAERALTDFQQQRKRRYGTASGRNADTEDAAKEYQHIGAKFDGLAIEGGLGTAFFASPLGMDSGLLWIQAHRSDSNAQEQRKKELQDITNRR